MAGDPRAGVRRAASRFAAKLRDWERGLWRRPGEPALCLDEPGRRVHAAGEDEQQLDQQAATTLEYVLLLAALVLPAYWIFAMALDALVGYYRAMVALNSLPLP